MNGRKKQTVAVRPVVVFAEVFTVIGGDDDHRVLATLELRCPFRRVAWSVVAASRRSAAGLALQVLRVSRPLHRDLRGGALDVAEIVPREFDGNRAEVLVQAL